jgi:hypothetical protein
LINWQNGKKIELRANFHEKRLGEVRQRGKRPEKGSFNEKWFSVGSKFSLCTTYSELYKL